MDYIQNIGNATVNAANMLPILYSKKMQYRFYAKTHLRQVANTDYEGDIKGQGSQVQIRTKPQVVIKDYNGNVDYQELTSGKMTLNIDQAKYYGFIEDNVQVAQADIPYVNAATDDASKNMVIEIERDVYAGIVPDFLPEHTITASVGKGDIVDLLVYAGRLLDDANVDDAGRNLLLPPWVCELIKTSELKDASLTGDRQSILRNGGKLGAIDRWEIFCSRNLPNDPGTNTTNAMGMTKHFLTFASQFEKHETVQLEKRFGVGHRGLNVFGFKGGIVPESGVLLNLTKA